MNRINVEVYASWLPSHTPMHMGQLAFTENTLGGVFSFSYDQNFLISPYRLQFDPLLTLHTGELHNASPDKNFRALLDSSPDHWGRFLMQRNSAIEYRKSLRETARLTELDYLLGVHDFHRLGGLRFRTEQSPDFLDNNLMFAAPPMASLPELEQAAEQIQQDQSIDSEDYYRCLKILISPGSSLGGARPKACVTDAGDHLWIAKFPDINDTFDVAAWEMLCHELALDAGVEMFPCALQKFSSEYHTFLTQRFDRLGEKRLHFSSAKMQLQHYDDQQETRASYLDIAEFLTKYGAQTKADLKQLWRRIIFNIAVSNTDDHLKNHGFLLTKKGWKLSPAYDLNPTTNKPNLQLNITDTDNALDYTLAFDVIDVFRLNHDEASRIYDDVLNIVAGWPSIANRLGIRRSEQAEKADAFRV